MKFKFRKLGNQETRNLEYRILRILGFNTILKQETWN